MKVDLTFILKTGGGYMFKVNDYISYTNKGIFQIKEIITKRNRKREKESWYILYKIKNEVETSIQTPATNPSLRPIMKKDDILLLIEDMPNLKTEWNDNKKEREDHFQTMLNSGDIRQWAILSKTIYEMKQQKEAIKKSLSEKDKFFYDRAEDLLYDEISICFQIQCNSVQDFISSNIPHA